MLLTAVLEQVKPLFKTVAGAANLKEAVKQNIPSGNCGFVVPFGETPLSNSRDDDVGQPLQEVVVTFAIVSGIKNVNDATGEQGILAIEAQRSKNREALYGWKPTVDHTPILLGSSSLLAFSHDGIWWVDRFTTRTWYQGQE